jgi:multidrug resistance efflux pump
MPNLPEVRPNVPEARHGAPGNGAPSLGDRVRSLRLAGRADAPARGRGSALPWALCVILLAITLLLGYRTYRLGSAAGTSPRPSDAADKPPAGSAGSPSPSSAVASSGELALKAKGNIIPAHQIQVSPKISGMIVWLHERFEEGQHFKEGEVLARLEDVDYKADRDRSKATLDAAEQRLAELKRSWPDEIAQARQELQEQEATLRQLKLDMQRSEVLARGNALAQRDYEQARYSYEAMERRVARLRTALGLMEKGPRVDKIKAAEAEVEQARADLAKAQWKLDNCAITAPVSGTILKKKAERGNLVIPSAFASDSGLSASLCDMADLSDIEVEVKIQERDIAQVVVGQRCAVMPEAYQNFEPFRRAHPYGYEGKLSRMMPTADRSNSSIPVRVKILVPKEEEGVYLKPDMGVFVTFQKSDK